jgi:hypothetical protein
VGGGVYHAVDNVYDRVLFCCRSLSNLYYSSESMVTCFTSERPSPPSALRTISRTPAQRQDEMSQQDQAPRSYTETDVQLALSDIQKREIKSLRWAEVIHNVLRRTIQRRRDGKRPRCDCEPNAKRLTKCLTKPEKKSIIERVLEEFARGIPSSKADVQDIANRLLRDRAGDAVGKNWVDRFVQRTPELRTRWSRPYDHQRAACEDPALLQPWFTLVQNMKAK